MKKMLFKFASMTIGFALGVSALTLSGNNGIYTSARSLPSLQTLQANADSGIEEEEYAVYSALINANTGDENRDRLLVINEQPSPWVGFLEEERDKFYEDLKKSSPELMLETVEDLRAKNKEQHKFARHFDIKRRYILVSEKELDAFFKEGGGWWEEFYRKYPKSTGIATFSRVGFNADRTQALVYQGHSCGGLCGGGSYLLLVKSNGVWTNKGGIGPTWVS